jgi:uncharacterized membrane-anchored protein
MNNKKRLRKSKRNIGMEILEGIQAIKAAKGQKETAMNKQRWTAHMSIEGLTQDQINALTLQIVEWVEAEGGFVAGGFAPETDDEKEPGTDQNQ